MENELKFDVPFDEYCELPYVNASSLATALQSWRDYKWQRDTGYTVRQDAVRVGTAAHLIVEYLPLDKFHDYFVVQPNFQYDEENVKATGEQSKSTATNYYKDKIAEFAAKETFRTILKQSEYDRLERILQGLQENDEVMDIISTSLREVAATGVLQGVDCKARIDGLRGPLQWDMKTTNDITEQGFGRTVRNFKYLFKDTFRMMLLNSCHVLVDEFKYIAVLDERVAEGGKARHAPQAVIVHAPMVVLENHMWLVRDKLSQLTINEETDVWPGMDSYTLQLNSWDMPDAALID